MKPVGYDIIGNLAILKFDRDTKHAQKKKFAEKFLREHKNVRTILDYGAGFSGRLRTHKTKYLAGDKTKEALYKENGCTFRLNVDACYFSGRLASERKEIAKKVKKKEGVLVMFGGVCPFGIVIAKLSKCKRVVSVELGRECNKYAGINVKRNKLQDVIELVQGDVRKKVHLLREKFDRIVMARPQLKDSFLDVAFPYIKKGGIIHYYGFSPKLSGSVWNNKIISKNIEKRDIKELKELVEREAKKAKKKIKILKVKKAGDVGPYRFRYRVDIKILN